MAAWWPGLLWYPVPMAVLVWAPDDAWALVLRPGGGRLARQRRTLAAGARPDGNGVPAVGGGIAGGSCPPPGAAPDLWHVAGHDQRLAPCGH